MFEYWEQQKQMHINAQLAKKREDVEAGRKRGEALIRQHPNLYNGGNNSNASAERINMPLETSPLSMREGLSTNTQKNIEDFRNSMPLTTSDVSKAYDKAKEEVKKTLDTSKKSSDAVKRNEELPETNEQKIKPTEYLDRDFPGNQLDDIKKDSSNKFKKGIDQIIGLPPHILMDPNNYMTTKVLHTMPIMEIHPALPVFALTNNDSGSTKLGLQLFSIRIDDESTRPFNSSDYDAKPYIDGSGNRILGENDEESNPENPSPLSLYRKILRDAGVSKYSSVDAPIRVAFLNDVNISESWSNEYGDSSFEDIGNITSTKMAELKFITGSRSISEMGSKGESILKQMAGGVDSGVFKSMFDTAGSVAGWAGKTMQGTLDNFDKVMPGMKNLLTGSQIDFPQIWKGCGYSPSYSVTVRLYNPNPSDPNMHKQYIVDPLAKLLAFVMPIADSDYTYQYPLLCQVNCPGLFRIKAGFISNIDVVKGGEGNDIAYTQRPGSIDVRITFGDLYGSMIATPRTSDSNRPTLKNYITNLSSGMDLSEDVPKIDSDNGRIFIPGDENPHEGMYSPSVAAETESTDDPPSRISAEKLKNSAATDPFGIGQQNDFDKTHNLIEEQNKKDIADCKAGKTIPADITNIQRSRFIGAYEKYNEAKIKREYILTRSMNLDPSDEDYADAEQKKAYYLDIMNFQEDIMISIHREVQSETIHVFRGSDCDYPRPLTMTRSGVLN